MGYSVGCRDGTFRYRVPDLVPRPVESPNSCLRCRVELLCSVLGVVGVGCRSRGELWPLLAERGL